MSDIEKAQSTAELLATGQLSERKIDCGDCGAPMKLMMGSFGKLIYGCTAYPDCHGTHSAHTAGRKIGKPLGRSADKTTREARRDAHRAFDLFWRSKKRNQKKAYDWLAQKMDMVNKHGTVNRRKCHIGRFNIDQCKQVMEICRKETGYAKENDTSKQPDSIRDNSKRKPTK